MIIRLTYLLIGFLVLTQCTTKKTSILHGPGRKGNTITKSLDPFDAVNPFIGTGGHGHTYPGATAPFDSSNFHPTLALKDGTAAADIITATVASMVFLIRIFRELACRTIATYFLCLPISKQKLRINGKTHTNPNSDTKLKSTTRILLSSSGRL